jgi:phosphatidylserine/phosphatidylglycerophosphate/cardiolipin synthase-like enzyme
MKRSAILPLLFLLLSPLPSYTTDLTLRSAPVSVFFSPKGGCTQAVIHEIGQARKEVVIQAYSFTSMAIAQALLSVHQQGIKVEAVLDKSQRSERYTSATFLANSGIPTWIDDAHAIAHNKVIVIDRETVITGSFNFTKAAEEKNAENLMIVHSRELAKLYLDNWAVHKSHSEGYRGRY